MVMTPKTMATRYRIWAYASAREWNVTIADIADAMGLPFNSVRSTIVHAGWLERIRGSVNTKAAYLAGGLGEGYHGSAMVAQDVASGRIGMTVGDA